MNDTVYICIPTTEERRERLAKCVESIHANAGVTDYVILTYENYREGFIGPIHKMLSGLNDNTLVWCIGDDSIIQPGALKTLLEAYRASFPNNDGIVNPEDGIQHGNIITMPLCAAATMRMGTHKGYFLNYADNEFTAVATVLGLYKYVPEAQVEHQHWIVGKAKQDQTYAFALTKWKDDEALFHKRKDQGFADNELLVYHKNK